MLGKPIAEPSRVVLTKNFEQIAVQPIAATEKQFFQTGKEIAAPDSCLKHSVPIVGDFGLFPPDKEPGAHKNHSRIHTRISMVDVTAAQINEEENGPAKEGKRRQKECH